MDVCLRVALGAEGLGLILTTGKRRLLDIPGGALEPQRVVSALGRRVKALYGFELSQDAIQVKGFVTEPELDRGDTKGLWFFVNGRYVRDRMLQRAVLDGYRGIMQRGRYPIVVLLVRVNPEVVDVNVHPAKYEVRFSNEWQLYHLVKSSFSESPFINEPLISVAKIPTSVFKKFKKEHGGSSDNAEFLVNLTTIKVSPKPLSDR